MSVAGKFTVVNPLAKSSYSYTKVNTLKKNNQKSIIGVSSSLFSLGASADSLQICCCSDTTSNPKRRGFGPPPKKSARRERQADKNTPSSGIISPEAPLLRSQIDGNSSSFRVDNQFEERLQEVKRLALQKKLEEEKKDYETIDYDAPTTETKSGTMGMATKIGAGVAVALFGVVFAFGDFIPSGSVSPNEEATKEDTRISPEERAKLKMRLQQFEEALSANPEDPVALEGSAVTLTELGEYNRAVSRLEDLCKKRGTDPDVFRLLGEVKYQVKDYEGSAGAYKMANMVSKNLDFEVLRGLTDALLAAKRPDEAVQVLLASRARLEKENRITSNSGAENKSSEETSFVEPIQLDLLLGKAYSDWGHVSDAVSVYDQIISNHPDDFRGYLAKGIILRANGNRGDAERMFIQARFFAPEKAKTLVDKYSRG